MTAKTIRLKYPKTINIVPIWDVVVCKRCGKEIRIIEGRLVDGKFFVHRVACK